MPNHRTTDPNDPNENTGKNGNASPPPRTGEVLRTAGAGGEVIPGKNGNTDPFSRPFDPAEAVAETLQRWRLSGIQWDFIASPARFSFFVGGIGSGKTFAGAVRAITRGVEQPGALGLIGAPTYPMLRDATQRTYFDLLPPALVRDFSKSEGHLRLTNGAEVLFRSLDTPDRVRGLNLAWFWLDEAPFAGHYAWQVLKGRLRQRGQRTAGWATGTPHGRDSFARDFELAPRPGHTLFRAATQSNQRNLPPGYIEELGYTGAFAQQEILGYFVAFEGLVYSFDASPQGHLRAWPGGEFARVIGGVDWGYTNPCAAVVFGLDGDRRAWQRDEFYQRRAELETVILPALVRLTRAHGVQRWYADPEDPEAIARLNAALAREGLACRAVGAEKGPGSVRAGIQTVAGLLAPRGDGSRGLYVDPRCRHTIAEYGTYAYATSDAGQRDPSEQPLKQGDHALDATRYALHGELASAAKTEAYLAAMQRRRGAE